MSDTNSPPPDDPDGAAPGGPGGPGHPGPPMAGPAWTPPRRPRPQAGGGPRPRHPGLADGAVAGRRGGPGQELGAVPAPLAPGGAGPGRRPGGPPGGAGGGGRPAPGARPGRRRTLEKSLDPLTIKCKSVDWKRDVHSPGPRTRDLVRHNQP